MLTSNEIYDVYLKTGSFEETAAELGISIEQVKRQVSVEEGWLLCD